MASRRSAGNGRPPSAPDRFKETISVKVKKGARLAINVRQSDNCVTLIHEDSPLFMKINIGDRILSVNGQLLDVKKLYELLKDNKEKILMIVMERLSFSWSHLNKTTLESISTEKESEKVIGRAINVFKVTLHDFTPSEIRMPLGIQIRYDARERVEICHITPHSLSSTHLRVGDIIREVNGRAVCTRSMCVALMQMSLCTTKVVTLTIETSVNGHDSYREQEEMPEEVLQIAKKQIEFMKKGAKIVPKGIAVKRVNSSTNMADASKKSPISQSPRPAKTPPAEARVSVAAKERIEFEHSADMDPNKLKSCKSIK